MQTYQFISFEYLGNAWVLICVILTLNLVFTQNLLFRQKCTNTVWICQYSSITVSLNRSPLTTDNRDRNMIFIYNNKYKNSALVTFHAISHSSSSLDHLNQWVVVSITCFRIGSVRSEKNQTVHYSDAAIPSRRGCRSQNNEERHVFGNAVE